MLTHVMLMTVRLRISAGDTAHPASLVRVVICAEEVL